MAQLTKMQQKIYDYIAQAIQDQGYPPSVREIGEAVGLKSPSTVHFHLKHMEEMGVLTKGAGKGRALTLAQPPQAAVPAPQPVQEEAEPAADRIPVVGTVAAGSPILAEECVEDYLTFDTGGREGEYFALRVRGESMLNAGILPVTFENPEDYDKLNQDAVLTISDIASGMEQGRLAVTADDGFKFYVNCALTERQRAILMAGGLLNYTKEGGQ